jgi:hypothetical protein
MKQVYKDGETKFDPRDDAPSVIFSAGTTHWHQWGLLPGGLGQRHWSKELNRVGAPAIVAPDGLLHWVRGGSFYREDGPPAAWPHGGSWWDGDPE